MQDNVRDLPPGGWLNIGVISRGPIRPVSLLKWNQFGRLSDWEGGHIGQPVFHRFQEQIFHFRGIWGCINHLGDNFTVCFCVLATPALGIGIETR